MYKYTKIETVFKRDVEGTKKLIEGKYRDKTVEYLKDNLWIGTEKIDGTNIGVVWDGYNITFQGRTEKANIPPFLMEYLENTFKILKLSKYLNNFLVKSNLFYSAKDMEVKFKMVAIIVKIISLFYLMYICHKQIYG